MRCFFIKFGSVDDHERIFNLTAWLFDQHVLSIVPFVRNKAWDSYVFSLVPFWMRIYNIPQELMDRKIVMEVEEAVRKVLAIDWRDKGARWVDFIRVRVLVDTAKSLRRVACLVDKEGNEITCVLKFERLPIFCYICGLVGHWTKKYRLYSQDDNPASYQFGRWMRVQLILAGQEGGRMRNGVEIVPDESNLVAARNQEVSIGYQENEAKDCARDIAKSSE